MEKQEVTTDILVIGSGLAGCMASYKLATKGKSVIVLEQGPQLDPKQIDEIFDKQTFNNSTSVSLVEVEKLQDGKRSTRYLPANVGGQANFYAAVSLRMRKQEFDKWPINYDDVEKYYSEAEKLLHVNGNCQDDPYDPPRSEALKNLDGVEMGPCAKLLKNAAQKCGMHPFSHPIAIDFHAGCQRCFVCNQRLCPFGAKFAPLRFYEKNHSLPIDVRPHHKAVEIQFDVQNDCKKVTGVKVYNIQTKQYIIFKAEKYIIASGAIQTPILLMKSGLDKSLPLIGKNLMVHSLGLVLGFFPFAINKAKDFEKWISITDFYFDDDNNVQGTIQQNEIMAPMYVLEKTPRWTHFFIKKFYYNISQFLVIAQDDALVENQVRLTGDDKIQVIQNSTADDIKRKKLLIKKAKKVLHKAGAWLTLSFGGLSVYHACGTCKMGKDKADSVVDAKGKVWDTENLYVADASIMPTSSGVNPSLTIAANALRIADYVCHE
ncbi:MAG: GMC family oxidoreductase [Bdellovibrionota bacterium]